VRGGVSVVVWVRELLEERLGVLGRGSCRGSGFLSSLDVTFATQQLPEMLRASILI